MKSLKQLLKKKISFVILDYRNGTYLDFKDCTSSVKEMDEIKLFCNKVDSYIKDNGKVLSYVLEIKYPKIQFRLATTDAEIETINQEIELTNKS